MNRSPSAIRHLAWVALALCACSEAGPKGYLSGTWLGGDVATSVRFVVDNGKLVTISVTPNPPSGFNWYCTSLTSANAIAMDVDVPVVADSIHVVLPTANWTATIDGKFYQVSASLELHASMALSGPACAGTPFNPVAFTARHQGE